MNKKAIMLLSGGLDSTLAVRVLLDQGIEITAVNFTSPFCQCSARQGGCGREALRVAGEFGIPIEVIAKGLDYMKVVEHPKFGYGRGMNPCLDCRIFMLKKAGALMGELGASFVATGEVLGQRPMSQHRRALEIIEKESGLEGLILRPLSAGNLKPTIAEREGIVDRERLLSIAGRSRKEQMRLAEGYGIREYPCPAGGCLLTDTTVSARLRDLFAHQPGYGLVDLQLLKIGRHFRLNAGLKLIVGRNEKENERIESLAPAGSVLISPSGFKGPTALLAGTVSPESEEEAGMIVAAFSRERLEKYPLLGRLKGGRTREFAVFGRYARQECDRLKIGF